MPSTPTPATIKDEWKQMVESGEVSLGISCVAYKMEKFSTKNGQLEKTEVVVFGRKFPLLDVRKNFLTEHEPYMRLQTGEQIYAMSLATLRSTADQYHHHLSPDTTIEELRTTIKNFQRLRSLILWHDHGTILGLGCILITVHVAYDPAIFYTQSEYEEKYSQSLSIQSLVEHSKVEGSNVEGVVQEMSCLEIWLTHSSNHGEVSMTYSHDLQRLATAGKFGKTAGNPKPFDNLRVAELREELHARGDYDTDQLKDDLQKKLDNTLCGVQRVPTMLLLDPKQSLAQLHKITQCWTVNLSTI